MARVTVEDCVQKVPNRFELVLLAAQRARNLSRGEELTIDRDNDKNPVVALREIAEETIELRAARAGPDQVAVPRARSRSRRTRRCWTSSRPTRTSSACRMSRAEEEAASLPVEDEEMSPEDIEAAIEAELGGRRR